MSFKMLHESNIIIINLKLKRRMKRIGLLIMVVLYLVESRKKREISDEMKNQCAVEEMNIRTRGTFVVNYVDQFDRIGVYNATDPDNNGDENRDSVEEF